MILWNIAMKIQAFSYCYEIALFLLWFPRTFVMLAVEQLLLCRTYIIYSKSATTFFERNGLTVGFIED